MFGCVLYELVTREEPYKEQDYAPAITKILKGETCDLPGEDICPPIFREIITMCWAYNPEERPSFSRIYAMLEASLWHLKKEESLWTVVPADEKEGESGYCRVEKKKGSGD